MAGKEGDEAAEPEVPGRQYGNVVDPCKGSPCKEPTIVSVAGARSPLREPQLAAQLVQCIDVSGVGHEVTGQAGAAIVVPDRVGAREGFVGRMTCTATAADCSQGCMHATK